jgi:hypothetical protein
MVGFLVARVAIAVRVNYMKRRRFCPQTPAVLPDEMLMATPWLTSHRFARS